MITLEDNSLSFTFPEIASELRRLANEEIDRLATRFLAENRASSFKTMVKEHYQFHSITEDYKRSATEALLSLTPEAIKKAIKESAGRSASFNRTAKSDPATTVSFQRTLRIPDDGKTYPLPPGLGLFPLVHIDDYAKNVPSTWNKRGGVMMPMYQAEALWIRFHGQYPCAVKVAAGKINAVAGNPWTTGLHKEPQDYLALPQQPWLDGYCVEKGLIRQFIAMPLGRGYSAEEQITGEAEHGGLQLQVYPLKATVYFEESIKPKFPKRLADILPSLLPVPERNRTQSRMIEAKACMAMPRASVRMSAYAALDMGLGAGGMMKQEIYQDERSLDDYDQSLTSRCFVHLCNSTAWQAITGSPPPHRPISSQLYAEHGLPWFDYYRDDLIAVEGSKELASIKTVADLYDDIEVAEFPDNESIEPKKLIQYGRQRRAQEVVEWTDEDAML